MRDKTKTLLYQWFNEVWNQGLEDSIDKLMAAESHAHGIIAPDQPKGPSGFKAFYRSFKDQFQNMHIDIKDVICQEDMESALTDVTAIHKETGKTVKFSGICMARIENSQIAEAWNHYDFLGMYQQLGQVLTPLAQV